MAELPPPPPALVPATILANFPAAPTFVGLLKDLVVPCSQAGSFICALCKTDADKTDEAASAVAALLCSSDTAYTHLTRSHARNEAVHKVTKKQWTELYVWLRTVIPYWYDYVALVAPLPPVVPGRKTKPGFTCSECGVCFSEERSFKRHQKKDTCSERATVSACTMMELYTGRSVAVSDTAAKSSDLTQWSAYDQAVKLAFQLTSRGNGNLPLEGFTPSATAPAVLPSHFIHGASQVASTGTARRPSYLEVLNWFADLKDHEATSIQSKLTELVRTGNRNNDASLLLESYIQFFVATVSSEVRMSGPTIRESVSHTLYQDGGMGRREPFSPVTEATERTYATTTAQLLVVCYRHYMQENCKELHSYGPLSIPGIKGLFQQLIEALRNQHTTEQQKNTQLARVFLSLLAECARPQADTSGPGGAHESTSLPAIVLRLSARSPILITALCISLIQRYQAGYRFATAEECRHMVVALLYDIKSFVIWCIGTWASGALLPQPVPQSVASAGLPVPLLRVGTMLGDESGTTVLTLLSAHNTVFQAAVTVASTARKEVESIKQLKAAFTPLHGYLANQYEGKVIFQESMYLTLLETRRRLIDTVTLILAGSGNKNVQIIPLDDFIDNGDMSREIVFGNCQQEMDRRAEMLPRREKESPTPDILNHLRILPLYLAVAVYFDVLGLGPRASEFPNLLALPTGNIHRAVKLDAEGGVMLLVGSEKNGKSTVLPLSRDLTKVIITYLAYIRPYLCFVMYGDRRELSSWLFPGLTPDALRDGINDVFSTVNRGRLKTRTDAGLQTLQEGSITDIGVQIIRQEAHRALYHLGVPDFVREMDLLSRMIKEVVPDGKEYTCESPGLKNFVHNIAIPKMASLHTLHTIETAFWSYGRTAKDPVPKPISVGSSVWLEFYRRCMCRTAGEAQERFPERKDIREYSELTPPTTRLTASKKRVAGAPDGPSFVGSSPGQLPQPSSKEIRLISQLQLQQQRDADEKAKEICEQVDNALLCRFGCVYLSDFQRDAVHAAATGEDVFVLLPTGSGKAWVWILYALAFPRKLVVLVLPLASLEQNMYDRLVSAFWGNSEYVFWLNSPPSGETMKSGSMSKVRIIVTSPGRVTGKGQTELMKFLEGRRVDLVCVDEVHEFALAAAYRHSFLGIGQHLRSLGAPIVCATATASKPMQNVIMQTFFSGKLEQLRVIQDTCSRKNISYQVRCHDNSRNPGVSPMEAFATIVVEILTAVENPWCSKGAMMIFAHTKDECKKLCDILSQRSPNVRFATYDGDMSPPTRRAILDDFTKDETNNKIKVLIGTKAIGCGFDYDGVSCVLHYGMAAESKEEFLQQSGRANRPGSKKKTDLDAGFSFTYFVPELLQSFLEMLTRDEVTAESLLAKEYGLPSPAEAALQMAEYCKLSPPACRQRWLAEALGEVNALTCIELGHRVSQMVDMARCDLCATNPRSYTRSQQVAAVASKELDKQHREWPATLKALTERFRPHVHGTEQQAFCLHCTLKAGCRAQCRKNHNSQLLFGRCFNCAAPGTFHYATQCTEMNELLPKSAGTQSRCFKCLHSLTPEHWPQCRSFSVLAFAAYALELIPLQRRDIMVPNLPEPLRNALEQPNWPNNKDLRRQVNRQLLVKIDGEGYICWAQKVLETLGKHLSLL